MPRKLTTIENSLIDSLALNQAVVTAMPFIKEAIDRKPKGTGCGGCGPKVFDYNPIKAAIATAPPNVIQVIKQALDTELIRVIYKVGVGVVEVLL